LWPSGQQGGPFLKRAAGVREESYAKRRVPGAEMSPPSEPPSDAEERGRRWGWLSDGPILLFLIPVLLFLVMALALAIVSLSALREAPQTPAGDGPAARGR
jgi:hypothetical protein